MVVLNTPAPVAAYTVPDAVGSTASALITRLVRPLLTAAQLVPAFGLLNTPPPFVPA